MPNKITLTFEITFEGKPEKEFSAGRLIEYLTDEVYGAAVEHLEDRIYRRVGPDEPASKVTAMNATCVAEKVELDQD